MKIKFGVIGLNHGHIYAMMDGLLKTGKTECVAYFAKEPELQARMKKAFKEIPLATSEKEILENPAISLVCLACINHERSRLTIEIMRHGKNVFVDKPAMTTLEQLNEIENVQRQTGCLWFVWYGERLMDPSSQKTLQLIHSGAIGRVINFVGLGPHKLLRPQRPDWMFDLQQYGGILNDLAIHPIEMFTQICRGKPSVISSRVRNFGITDLSSFQDFGDATLEGPKGETAYIRVDWFTPEAMPTFGDIRNIIVGTEGMIELRKKVDFAVDNHRFTGCQLLMATHQKEPHRIPCDGIKITFYEELVRDVIERRNRCIPHKLSFAACRATLEAQLLSSKNPLKHSS